MSLELNFWTILYDSIVLSFQTPEIYVKLNKIWLQSKSCVIR